MTQCTVTLFRREASSVSTVSSGTEGQQQQGGHSQRRRTPRSDGYESKPRVQELHVNGVDSDDVSTGYSLASFRPHSLLRLKSKPSRTMTFLKVVTLGAPGCGKTSLVKQFVTHSFPDEHITTEKPEHYYPTIFADNSLFELRITDLPPIASFPQSTIEEWTLYQGYGLRSANAFLLLLDITSAESFKFAKAIKEQWQMSGLETPFVIVSSKWDLIQKGTTISTGGGGSSSGSNDGGKSDMSIEHYKKELANAIKKQWKCPYVECSAKYNWNVTAVFKEVVTQLEKVSNVNRYNLKLFNGPNKSTRKRTCPFL